ncbi:hypothetical protein [Natrononativus amylolyticus]|uniref:hypothetical protein n=1 Tax=Natrononativus amylolyticus TaxID=2963434 RepID=UPI0020CC271D|nr:hypothetical protein [Natrononativus amylolyticus]
MAVVGTDRDEDDELDRRAITEIMTVMDNVGTVRNVPGLYEVTSASGKTYLVDTISGACECPDSVYRQHQCKHYRRVAFATGTREIPMWIDPDDADAQLGEHVSGKPRWSE